ncbi:MAG: DEAD/DEAH box helicase [Spirochaetes bacterium]|nr:DEAD/DEAH box helicase [Spirochaetota bacterium]
MDSSSLLGLGAELSTAFIKLGYKEPTKIQTLAIPALLGRKDLFIQSETGTGKTFAYLAPIFSAIKSLDPSHGPLALVLCPTQELVVQVAKKAGELAVAAGLDIGVCPVIGGSPLSRQEAALKHKPYLVVGSPGRTLDLISMRSLRLENLQFLVLDEGDRLFAKEYRDPVSEIMRRAPKKATRLLASATISDAAKTAASVYMKDPESIDLLDEGVLSKDIEHWVFYVEHRRKIDFLRRLDNALKPKRCLVFASSGDRVTKAAERLIERGIAVESLLARQEKEHRRLAIERFEAGDLRYLVTSDLGARGLDIAAISHIISLDFPEESFFYIHRAGRTGRAGLTGISILLADAWEIRRASKLAVDRGFVFRTKALAEGQVVEPSVEEFFAKVEKGEDERREYLKKRDSSNSRRR